MTAQRRIAPRALHNVDAGRVVTLPTEGTLARRMVAHLQKTGPSSTSALANEFPGHSLNSLLNALKRSGLVEVVGTVPTTAGATPANVWALTTAARILLPKLPEHKIRTVPANAPKLTPAKPAPLVEHRVSHFPPGPSVNPTSSKLAPFVDMSAIFAGVEFPDEIADGGDPIENPFAPSTTAPLSPPITCAPCDVHPASYLDVQPPTVKPLTFWQNPARVLPVVAAGVSLLATLAAIAVILSSVRP